MKVLCFGYREWGQKIFRNISRDFKILNDLKDSEIIIARQDMRKNIKEFINEVNPDVILFCGWSWMIPPEITNNYLCIGLHPSPLPKYKGGSPIQNQIQNGEKVSAVSLFQITEELDGGDILFQKEIPLDGFIDDIFERIVNIGSCGIILTLLKIKRGESLHRVEQAGGTLYKRLKNNSEITMEDLQNMSAVELYNKIRMLSGFYPNTYITCADGVKLYIERARLENK